MADEQHQPGGGADGPEGVDETRQFAPFDADDDRTVAGGDRPAPAAPGGPGDPGATTAMPGVPGDPAATTAIPGVQGRPGDPAATTAMPGDPWATRATPGVPGDSGATTAMPPVDATAPLHQGPAAGGTAPLPRPDGTGALPPAVWSGRAEVRPPTAPVVRTAGPVGWEAAGWEADERPGRTWWMPILLGLLALLLISLLGVGVWLITQSGSRSGAPVVPSPSATPSRKVASTAPTSAAPTTATPPAATTATPAAPDVVMPDLVGQSSQEARDALDDLNLTYRLRSQPSDQAAGTVIETDPPAGRELPVGARVTLVIASPPRTTAAAPRPTVTPTSPTPTR
ncbi:MAG TPA: PASTA domain-containing protein [Catenuloplanes sp.]|jgi:hypothetical protein